MREFAKISAEFWTSLGKKIRGCEAEAKVLVFYLMTCRHTNMLGIYYLPLTLASHEIGIAPEGVRRGIEALIKVGFCSYDEESEYVWVHETAASQLGALKKNDNRVKHANRVFKNLPKLPFLADFYKKYRDLLHLEAVTFFCPERSPFEALEIRDRRLEIRDDRLDIRNNKLEITDRRLEIEQLSNLLDEEQTKISDSEIQICQDNEEEKNRDPLRIKKINSVVFAVPLRQGKQYHITEKELTEWQANYPDIDVCQEIRQLIAWNQANPDRQKSERGISRHIQGWLAHTKQNQSKGGRDSPHSQLLSTWDHNMAVVKAVLEEDHGIEG